MEFTTAVENLRRAIAVLRPIANAAANSKAQKIITITAVPLNNIEVELQAITAEEFVTIRIPATVQIEGVLRINPTEIAAILNLLRASDTVTLTLAHPFVNMTNTGSPQLAAAFYAMPEPAERFIIQYSHDEPVVQFHRPAVNAPMFLRSLKIATQYTRKPPTNEYDPLQHVAIMDGPTPQIHASDGYQGYICDAPYINWQWEGSQILLPTRAVAALLRVATAASHIEISPTAIEVGPTTWSNSCKIEFRNGDIKYPNLAEFLAKVKDTTRTFTVDTKEIAAALRIMAATGNNSLMSVKDGHLVIQAYQTKDKKTTVMPISISMPTQANEEFQIPLNTKYALNGCKNAPSPIITIGQMQKNHAVMLKLDTTEYVMVMPMHWPEGTDNES